MVAEGVLVIVTFVVVEKSEQPPVLVMKYLIVYVPAVAPEGIIVPVDALIGNPVAGLMEKTPPALPVSVTGRGGFDTEPPSTALHKTFLL
jgi:hypothetical protein